MNLLQLVIPSLISGIALIAVGRVLRSRSDQGRRIGRLEQWRDRELGRREGRAEVRREIREGKRRGE